MEYKKGDRVSLSDGGVVREATVAKDGIDNRGKVRVKPDAFPFEVSVTTNKDEILYLITD